MNHLFWLADDDSDDAEMFCEALSEVDAATRICRTWDGGGILQMSHNEKEPLPDMIFLDINMPGVNGWECLKQLKQSPNISYTPVIMYTTSSSKTDINKAFELGALCFITKPTDYNILLKILDIIVTNLQCDLLQALKDADIPNIQCHADASEQPA